MVATLQITKEADRVVGLTLWNYADPDMLTSEAQKEIVKHVKSEMRDLSNYTVSFHEVDNHFIVWQVFSGVTYENDWVEMPSCDEPGEHVMQCPMASFQLRIAELVEQEMRISVVIEAYLERPDSR